MEVNDIFSIICFSIPILIIIGIIFLVVIFFVVRSIVRRARRKAGIPKGTGNVIRKQLANFDQYIQNDERQTKQWQSSTPLNEPKLNLEDIDVGDLPARTSSRQVPKTSDDPTPNWANDSLTCEACGAPQEPQHHVCPFCGHKQS